MSDESSGVDKTGGAPIRERLVVIGLRAIRDAKKRLKRAQRKGVTNARSVKREIDRWAREAEREL